jgi:hypothetical protein
MTRSLLTVNGYRRSYSDTVAGMPAEMCEQNAATDSQGRNEGIL